MGSIQHQRAMSPQRGVNRQAGRILTTIDNNAVVDRALVEACADIQAAQIDAVTAVTTRGLQAAAFINSVEMTLADASPSAMTRLKLISDTGTMGVAGVLADTVTKLRRI